MQRPNQLPKIEPCDICGDIGFPEVIVTCIKCKVAREHCYCLRVHTTKVPVNWICESCQSKNGTASTCNANRDPGRQAFKWKGAAAKGKVKFIPEDEVIKLSSGSLPAKSSPAKSTLLMNRKACVKSKNCISKIPSLALKSNPSTFSPVELAKLLRNGVPKNPVSDQQAYRRSLSKGPMKEYTEENQKLLGRSGPEKEVLTLDLHTGKPKEGAPREVISARKSLPGVGSGGIICAVAEGYNIENGNIQSIEEGINLYGNFLPSSVATWRGCFAASGKFYAEFEAHPPSTVNDKAYQLSKRMPSVLQLESLSSSDVFTDAFQNDCPNLQDIALYFFPSESDDIERSRKNLNSISEFMNAERLMLRSSIDGVELLVFTSNELNMLSSGTIAAVHVGCCFLWGVFRRSKATGVEPVDMDVDMIGGKDVVGRIDHVLNAKKPRSTGFSQHSDHLNMSEVPPGFKSCVKLENICV